MFEISPELLRAAAITYGYILLWIFLSASTILINKYLLSEAGFPFPIALTLTVRGSYLQLYRVCPARALPRSTVLTTYGRASVVLPVSLRSTWRSALRSRL
jgi:hypothetical protein